MIKFVLRPLKWLRVAIAILIPLVSLLILRVVMIGQKPNSTPQGIRRYLINKIVKIGGRLYLVALGYYWIKQTNKHLRDPKVSCIIANHISGGLDSVAYLAILSNAPSFVGKKEIKDLPLFGAIGTALRTVYVERRSVMGTSKTGDDQSTSKTGDDQSRPQGPSGTERIRERLHNWKEGEGQLVMWPEGTTNNQTALLPFHTGVFRAGVPLQPCVMRMPFKHSDPSDASRNSVKVSMAMGGEFINHMEVEWLPTYYPSEQEKADPRLYADNVRHVMSAALGIPESPFTYRDKLVYMGKKPYDQATDAWKAAFGEDECVHPVDVSEVVAAN